MNGDAGEVVPASAGSATLPDTAPPAPPAPPQRSRQGRLFRKYLLLILTLVSGALLTSGAISIYFSYQEQKTALGNLQQEKAIAAASRIEQYIRQIEQQLAYAALPQLDASDVELRRIEFLKLLRQVPEVTDITQLDATGREQVAVSRLGMDVIGSGKDRSQEPAFVSARRGQPWIGPVYFRKETEPYMTIAVRSTGSSGPVTIAEVNLKFIWDVVSRIKIGDKGKAYVVDDKGYLVADPDIGLVLRKTNLSELAHVRAAADRGFDGMAMLSHDLGGTPVLVSVAPIEALAWKVFVEQPVSEVYAKLNASILRTGLLLLVGLVISALGALALARGMVRPIRTLSDGAQRIGEGNLDQRIDVRTGDELEALADRFNRMSSQLKESYAGLERKVDERTHELTNSLEQQTAISEILRVISGSPTDVQPVLDAVAERAAHLCAAPFARIMLVDSDVLIPAAEYWEGKLTEGAQWQPTQPVPLNRTSVTGRAFVDRETIHLADIRPLLDGEFAGAKENMLRFNCRAVLGVPLMREGGAYGGIFLARHQPGFFAPDQVALVETFAQQAAIAIDNVRLFNETKEALDQQTAISEVLRVIASSPGDVRPMLDAVAERAMKLCDASQATIVLVAGGALRCAAAHGATRTLQEGEVIPLTRGSVAGRAVIDRVSYQIEDLATAPEDEFPVGRELQRRIGHHTALAVPLMREDHAIGAIQLWRMETQPFTEKQVALVRTFADQAAIAIENVRLFNETKEALEQQTAISEILRVISGSPTDVQPVLDAVAERALKLCGAAQSVIALVEGTSVRFVSGSGNTPNAVGEVVPLTRGLVIGRAIIDRSLVHVPDLAAVPPEEFPEGREMQERIGHRTTLAVPLMREGRAIGAIAMWRMEARPFAEKETRLIRTFADQAAIAIDNVRLFNETKEALDQQRASGEVLAAISSSIADTAPVFETILASCERLFAGKMAVIDLVGEDGLVHLGAYHGANKDEVRRVYPHTVDTTSATGTAIATGGVVHFPTLDGVPKTARTAFDAFGIEAAIGAPMMWEGKGIGAIWVAREYAGPFSEKDIALLRTFADQAVIAIQNARLFREIEDKSRQLEIANQHKSAFLASMSHELRTPLNAIIGFSEVLLARFFGELNEKQDDYLKDIHSSGRHLLNLINDVLDLSKVEAGRMELDVARFDLPAALADAMTLIRERATKHGIALDLDAPANLGSIAADERKFKQILLNLLSNAVKFTPDGGSIAVTAVRDQAGIRVAVKDTGIGIAAADQEAVFEEFRQVGTDYTSKQEGTGLGLALTRRFVELHGGRIWLESAPGKGSTFFFNLPDRP